MNSFRKALVSLTAAFTMASCVESTSAVAPPAQYETVPTPDWVNDIKVDVRKRGADVINKDGTKFHVDRSGTDIGYGLVAKRDKNDLYITDSTGVECNWNRSEHLDYARKVNPEYVRYQDSIRKLKPR